MPAIVEFLNGVRVGFSNYNGPYTPNLNGAYAWWYYPACLLRLIAPPGSTDNMAFAAIVLFAWVLLFFSKGKRVLKIFIVTSLAFLLTSVGGLVMNGFQYPSNRWTFGIVLVSAYVLVEMLPQLLDLSRKQQVMCIAVLVFYTTACFVSDSLTPRLRYITVGVIFLALTLLVLSMSLKETDEQAMLRKKGRAEKTNYWIRECLCLLLVIANVGVFGIYRFAPSQHNYVNEFTKSRNEIQLLESAPERRLVPYLLNEPKGRADGVTFERNRSMVWQIPAILFYSSTICGSTAEFMEAVENSSKRFIFELYSSDQRAITNTLLSAKYHVEPRKNAGYVPYGYKRIKKLKKSRVIYENKYALPWGYTYDHAISYSQLEHLNGVEKQEAMLQAIALDEEAASVSKWNGIQFDEKKLSYELVCKGCKWKDGKLVVSRANASITLQFSMPAAVEGYVRLKGLNINNPKEKTFNYDPGRAGFFLIVKCRNVVKSAFASTHFWEWYYGRENYLFNIGYSERERNSLTITFPRKGTYKLKDIELFALPMDNYPARVEALRAEPLENIKWGTNSLSGTVDLSKDKVLCVSVPYSKGWSATVDGEKAEILRGNYMFMALPLKAGHHDIKFSYCTPGLKLGAVLSALSACIVAGMFMRDRRRRKNVG